MAPEPPPAPTVLRGPRRPFWACGRCSAAANWASRIRCQCGNEAPLRIRNEAWKAHKAAVAALPPGQSGAPLPKSKGKDDTSKRLAEMEKLI
eukprot:9428962-Pyramimonas_sp.AAC.1